MKHHAGQTYMDLAAPQRNQEIQAVDPNQLPGQTTFDLINTAHILSIIGDGTTATL